jgi:hypothetical protein
MEVMLLAVMVLLVSQSALCMTVCMLLLRQMNVSELPKVPNPVKAIKEHKASKEAKAEQDRISTILQNIENYDGTANGQEDVPWR